MSFSKIYIKVNAISDGGMSDIIQNVALTYVRVLLKYPYAIKGTSKSPRFF